MPVKAEVLKISVNGTDISFAIRFTIKFFFNIIMAGIFILIEFAYDFYNFLSFQLVSGT